MSTVETIHEVGWEGSLLMKNNKTAGREVVGREKIVFNFYLTLVRKKAKKTVSVRDSY